MRKKAVVIVLGWLLYSVICCFMFGRYAYEINEFNARTRVFLRTGETNARTFDERGLPTSHSARSGGDFVSPFYVVHYGLIYSETIPGRNRYAGFHWRKDQSTEFWDVPPPEIRSEYFQNSLEWVVNNLDSSQGQAHLLYKFDWPYKNYPSGGLKAPWWSGLTDGFAIILLMRGYDVYDDERYLRAAVALYRSVLTPVSENGSLVSMRGMPWIEEYVDPRADEQSMSRVLNGMIYATYGIDAFERVYSDKSLEYSARLYRSIEYSIESFNLRGWSYYDSIGSSANIKYHRLHVALLSDLEQVTGSTVFNEYREKWSQTMKFSGYWWMTRSSFGIAQIHFLLSFLLSLSIPIFLVVMSRATCHIRASRNWRRHK